MSLYCYHHFIHEHVVAWLVAYGKCYLPHVRVKGHTIEEISAVDLDPTAVIDSGGLGP